MRIAIVKLSALGDIIHSTIVLQLIKSRYPDIVIDWFVEKTFAAILEDHPHIDNLYTLELKRLKNDKLHIIDEFKSLRTHAKRNRYNLVIDLQGLIKSAVIARILGKCVGFDKNSIREKVAALFYHQNYTIPYEENVIIRSAQLMAHALDFTFTKDALYHKEPTLFCAKRDGDRIRGFFNEKKSIVYMLGSSWRSKVYPKEKFLTIIRALDDAHHLLVWGDETEHQSAQFIATHTHATLVPKLTLGELKALVGNADLIIGGDSGPTHCAWAMNRPSITIFGPTPAYRNTLSTTKNVTIDCDKSINPLKLDKNDRCIESIDPNRIIDMAKGLLTDA
jgi:heptosyltransferase-1